MLFLGVTEIIIIITIAILTSETIKFHKFLLILIPWSRVLFQKSVNECSPSFLEPKGSLPCSQLPATCRFPESENPV
jgi:hypothetical protein